MVTKLLNFQKIRKMKYIICCLFFIVFSCKGQEENFNIMGNWYNYENTFTKEYTYTESYINHDTFVTYHDKSYDFGSKQKYLLKGSVFYFIDDNGDKIESSTIEVVDNDSFKMRYEGEEGYLFFKRVKEESNLENYILKKTDKKAYLSAFLDRKKLWEDRFNPDSSDMP